MVTHKHHLCRSDCNADTFKGTYGAPWCAGTVLLLTAIVKSTSPQTFGRTTSTMKVQSQRKKCPTFVASLKRYYSHRYCNEDVGTDVHLNALCNRKNGVDARWRKVPVNVASQYRTPHLQQVTNSPPSRPLINASREQPLCLGSSCQILSPSMIQRLV